MKPIIPSDLQNYYDDWQMSPGLECNSFLFLTGFTGVRADGSLSSDPETQIREAFDKVCLVLREAGLSFGAVVEMTTYHVGLREHLDIFKQVRSEYVKEPYPAWTAIDVVGLVREGAFVEVRAIAKRDGDLLATDSRGSGRSPSRRS